MPVSLNGCNRISQAITLYWAQMVIPLLVLSAQTLIGPDPLISKNQAGVVLKIGIEQPLDMIEWSPDGKTLAYIQSDVLSTVFPTRAIKLPSDPTALGGADVGRLYYHLHWNSSGSQILINGTLGTIVIDISSGTIVRKLPEEAAAWWLGNKLCWTKQQQYEYAPKDACQPYWVQDELHYFPRGFTFDGASRDGHSVLAVQNWGAGNNQLDREHEYLFTIDERRNVTTGRRLFTIGRIDMHVEHEIARNPSRNLVARTVDLSGGGTTRAYLDDGRSECELDILPGPGPRNYTAGNLRWLDNRFLSFEVDSFANVMINSRTSRVINTLQFCLYDAQTGSARPIYESSVGSIVAASNSYAAIVEGTKDSARLIISEWRRSAKGHIITTVYQPPVSEDLLDQVVDYLSFYLQPDKPLVGKRIPWKIRRERWVSKGTTVG